jgi:serine/threonine-protein kinase
VSSLDLDTEFSLGVGSLLQDRYQLVQLLGQGGFARTYLAQDLGRFNEYCVLKEFIPNQQSTFLLEKAREMFQREATILYEIQHPQIPQFRATFEAATPAGTRLFLVQDYVAGPTYRQWLRERQQQGLAFSEAEVRQLLQQILPVLSYLHQGGIVHRDISPENLILRLPDHCPVLIDFGVVKEIASRLHGSDSSHLGTAVGKLGYAPIEQLQAGRSYPSSDLYSLAVSALVLLTGKEPQELFEDQTLTWRWQGYAEVRPEFAELLNHMLASRPGDRLQSADEVLTELQVLPDPITTPISTEIGGETLATALTITLPRPEASANPKTRPKPAPPPNVVPPSVQFQRLVITNTPTQQQPWQRQPLVYLIGLGIIAAVATGLTLWWLQKQPQLSTPSPTLTSPSPAFNPVIVPPPDPGTYSRPLNLTAGNSIAVTGTLQRAETHTYEIMVRAGQQLQIQPQEVVGLTARLLNPDQQPISSFQGQYPWSNTMQRGGIYRLQIQGAAGPERGRYQFTVGLLDPILTTPFSHGPVYSPVPISPQPGGRVGPRPENLIVFAPNQRFQELQGRVEAGKRYRFTIPVRRGQTLSAVVVNGYITLNIRAPNGRPLASGSNVLNWQGKVWQTGNYQLELVAPTTTTFDLKVGLR